VREIKGCSQVQPVPRIAQRRNIDFLSGFVTVENAMIALIDLFNLLSSGTGDGVPPTR
jgi:hypothetical protein